MRVSFAFHSTAIKAILKKERKKLQRGKKSIQQTFCTLHKLHSSQKINENNETGMKKGEKKITVSK